MNDFSKTAFSTRVRSFWADFLSYFDVAGDLEPQADAEQSIRQGVSFKGSQLLVLIFAIFIASLGLNTGSIPVIIGAMLISPLMGPIIGMGLAIGIQDYDLLKRSLKNISMAILGSLLTSALYFLISPQYEDSSQLLARTSPSIYDVFVALFGGAAGILSIAARNKGQVMPGVAIATSLMPPLCTAGYGLATLQMQFFLGALYLFFTNMVFILFASLIGVKLMKYKKVSVEITKRYRRVQAVVLTVVTLTIGVSCFLTYRMIQKSIFTNKANLFVEKEMVFPNTQVLSHKVYINKGHKYIDVTLIGEALPKDSLQLALMNKLDSVGLGGTVLHITQGFSMENPEIDTDRSFDKFYQALQSEISHRQDIIDSLRNEIRGHEMLADQSVEIAPEVRVLFPSVADIALGRIVLSSTGSESGQTPASLRVDTVNMAMVRAPKGLTQAQREKLAEYISVRLNIKKVHVSINPPSFPWPQE